MVDGSSLTRRNEEQGVPSEGSGERPAIRTILLVIIALVLSGWALHAMSSVFVPLVASVMIALAVMPVRDWVQRRVSRKFGWLGVVAAMTLLLLVVGLFFGALWLAAQQMIAQVPGGTGQITQVIEQAMPQEGAEAQGGTEAQPPQGDAGSSLPLGLPSGVAEPSALGQVPQAGQESGGESAGGLASRFGDTLVSVLTRVAKTLLGSAVGIVSALVVIFFLTLLILIESRDWGRKISTITHWRTEWRLTESAEVIAQKVRAYLLIRGVLGLATAALYGLWLWFFGAGLIFVWALLTFLLNFIPTVGSIIAGLLPVIYIVATQDLGTAVAVGAGLLVIEQVMGNFIDPKVSGNRISVSPLVVLVGLLFWSWIWGIPGALLAAPVTVALVVLGAHVPILRPWALLLSDRTDMEGLTEATRPK
ncbi:AI-2E family transporter [Paracoccus salipaludis]|uniref:AI-2E family transporter n=1 Tax=Paracoccus salipaludis TaxID=2032623 RepID=A0A2A2GHM0_9RHOB|nr:AI-2E family transporter [Paracoccus salipaludis]PAU97106.1 AI-2E family transporter [Paracoccus salipaludis]